MRVSPFTLAPHARHVGRFLWAWGAGVGALYLVAALVRLAVRH